MTSLFLKDLYYISVISMLPSTAYPTVRKLPTQQLSRLPPFGGVTSGALELNPSAVPLGLMSRKEDSVAWIHLCGELLP